MDPELLLDPETKAESTAFKDFFSTDSRFQYEGLVGRGGFGTAHSVKYVDPKRPGLTRFLVKKSLNREDAEEMLDNEVLFLKKFKGAMHIVQFVDIKDNPLDKWEARWMVLEWISNGTLSQFIGKAKKVGLSRLPNRTLWRFFLCLIRALNGIAWPSDHRDSETYLETPLKNEPPSDIEHGDMHGGNVLLADFIPDGEHLFTPLLKVIDFGLSTEFPPEMMHSAGTAVERNLFDVGKLMVCLVTMERRSDVRHPTLRNNPLTTTIGKTQVQTMANKIFEAQYEWLDPDLRTLIALCLAMETQNRPSLHNLTHWLAKSVEVRDAKWYKDVAMESDETVNTLCRDILFNAEVTVPN
ncbi:hypothetical protein M426DRAFT_27297 [Hypoxylon sp. CI-4A]|nr:hypothetical protein M426DRAFT_27297 [Hypoxylon sp. CI-4A]